ncbi:MAG: hypothetical protein K9W42_04645 [Candidatus Heimdallarchaeota archaeon]|nr:hypothetical protein [Candidatus Heimdallarchaeota archaeon]
MSMQQPPTDKENLSDLTNQEQPESRQAKLLAVLFRFELERTFRSKSLIIFLAIYFTLALLIAILLGSSYDTFLEQLAENPFTSDFPLFKEIEINSKTWANFFSVNMSINSFVTQLGLIVTAFYGAQIVTRDLKNESILLVTGTRVERWTILLAKYFTACITSLTIVLSSTFFSIICMDIVPLITEKEVVFKEVVGYSMIYFLRAILPIILYVVTITAVSMLVGVFVKTPTFAIIGSIVVLLFYDSIFSTAYMFAPSNWHLEYFSPSANLLEIIFWAVGIVSGGEVIFQPAPWGSLVIFPLLLLGALCGAFFRFQKMDFK